LRILVNTRLLLYDKLDGIGWFAFETLKRITAEHPEYEFIFVFDRPFHPDFVFSSNVRAVVAPPPTRHPVLIFLWFELSIPFLIRKLRPDVFLSPDGFLSLSAKVKSLTVIHDLNFEHNPQDLPWKYRVFYRFFFKRYAKKASRIATVSEFSASDISQHYSVIRDKIDVVYNGVAEGFKPLPPERIREIREEFSEGDPYFIFVGSIHPRKNIINLLKAFDLFRLRTSYPMNLLIVGKKQWCSSSIEETHRKMKYQKDVIFTGRLDVDKLQQVVASAFALTYVSLFEGFGIPLLEAMKCNVPVITSNITSMPEVAGDAALFVDPYRPDEIAQAMEQLATNEQLRKELIRKGAVRCENFSWELSANLLWQSIMKTIHQTQ